MRFQKTIYTPIYIKNKLNLFNCSITINKYRLLYRYGDQAGVLLMLVKNPKH